MISELDGLSSADRGFVTWLASVLREPVEAVWQRLASGETRAEGPRLTSLDLTPIGPRLRWAVGAARRLSLPFAGLDGLTELDCTGLDLDLLDVRFLPGLRALRCGDNRLRELDPSACAALEVLDCSRNQLMVLDLRGLRALRRVSAGSNALGLLVLGESDGTDPLEVLDCSHNQLMVLDLGARPSLRVLRCERNALARLALREAPALEHLDASHNDLTRIDAGPLPALEALYVGHNRLGGLDLGGMPRLRELVCRHNYVGRLDLTANAALETIDARENQLLELVSGELSRLVELDLSSNRLAALGLSAPALQILGAACNQLAALPLGGCPRLRSLDVSRNPLRALDLAATPELVELRAVGTALPRVDIRANVALARMSTRDDRGRGPEIVATPRQSEQLGELRSLFGLGTGASEVRELNAYELHDLALTIAGGDAEHRLLSVVTAPCCDLGTALMVYWTSSPHRYRRYHARQQVPPYELAGWDLLAAIEDRIERDGFPTALIPFDPADDRRTRSVRGVDWTRSRAPDGRSAELRELPPRLRRPVPPPEAAEPGATSRGAPRGG